MAEMRNFLILFHNINKPSRHPAVTRPSPATALGVKQIYDPSHPLCAGRSRSAEPGREFHGWQAPPCWVRPWNGGRLAPHLAASGLTSTSSLSAGVLDVETAEYPGRGIM